MSEEVTNAITQLKELLNKYPDKTLDILQYVFGKDTIRKIINKPTYEDLQQENEKLKKQNARLTREVCNRLIVNYDYSSTLKDANKITNDENKQLKALIEEVREYLTSYSSIHTIQFGTEEDSPNDIELNKTLDNKTIIEMTHRYLKVHDKLLQILDKAGETNE